MSEIISEVQKQAIRTLTKMLQDTLADAQKTIEGGQFLTGPGEKDALVETFIDRMTTNFDVLRGVPSPKEEVVDFETLSLIEEEAWDTMVAIDGMVAAARNEQLPSLIGLNTRLSSLVPETRIDESTNPLDPGQIASAFTDAIKPLGLNAQNTIILYRGFNKGVLKQLTVVLEEANQSLIGNGIIPNLSVEGAQQRQRSARAARSREPEEETESFGRPEPALASGDMVETTPYQEAEEQPEMFSMMQNLLHAPAADSAQQSPVTPGATAPAGQGTAPPGVPAQQPAYAIPAGMVPDTGQVQPGAGMMQQFVPDSGQTVQLVDQQQLMSILSNIQEKLSKLPVHVAEDTDDEQVNIQSSLGEALLEGAEEGAISAVDQQSSDVINLVTMLYEAIWQDASVPIPIKELIGRTQITIMKVALFDSTFFNEENHPGRALLNEFASAGIGWTEVEDLESDPLYKKIEESVQHILDGYEDDVTFFEELLKDFKAFRAREAAKRHRLEQRIHKAKEGQARTDDAKSLVTQRIEERILGRDLHPFVQDLLENAFHKFMVLLVLKEGPGSKAWKQAINTIDVLQWSVQEHAEEADRGRLDTINPRLLNNLRKAFRIAGIEPEEIDALIVGLREAQEESFVLPEAPPERSLESLELELVEDDFPMEQTDEADTTTALASEQVETRPELAEAGEETHAPSTEKSDELEILADDDPYMQQVEDFSIGTWVEFLGEEENQNIRCKLAARINAIDKLIFVNRQGVKVAEQTQMGLARELKQQTVKVVSDGLLFSRALETVIGTLRIAQEEQQSGSAYNPDAQSPEPALA